MSDASSTRRLSRLIAAAIWGLLLAAALIWIKTDLR